jgi:hypothetical protein
MTIMPTERDKVAMKQATQLIATNKRLPKKDPKKRTIVSIVTEVNNRMNANISTTTASRYGRNGLVNTSPL